MEYAFNEIEAKWREYWAANRTYRVEIDTDKPKYYVLDMFPYPSGAGLHVGHPLGYIASDIYARYKRCKGYNVLHPMGFDAFGLPAEQYAIQTGQHPRVTTEANIATYKRQLDKLGFCYDWEREVNTSEPGYYRWTQWVFLQLFGSWYNLDTQKAAPIDSLIGIFVQEGNGNVHAACGDVDTFTAEEWQQFEERQQQEILQQYRLAYQSHANVNWCAELGTVLANDEVQDGLSVRGGYPVVKKSMKQWFLRITAYTERLLRELDDLDWPESMKDMQRNWIGRSEGAEMDFPVADSQQSIRIFTTRPDTVFGATFMVLAPEHELIAELTTADQQQAVDEYITYATRRSERERQADVKQVTGVFTGSYCLNPFTQTKIPIWIGEYVLAGYGTGAIMCVPAHDSRDYAFARHFDLPIIRVVDGEQREDGSYDDKEGKLMNSGFLDGLEVREAIRSATDQVEKLGIGERQVNFKMRDAAFSRQRYWGEPFPIYYEDQIARAMPVGELPLTLPEIDSYKPTSDGEPPLARADNWQYQDYPVETDTMPGYAGSSWYFFRYMDPANNEAFVSKQAQEYWENVDLYIGGAEHATGHLLYARFWTHFLYDLGYVNQKEPFKKLINQGMIQGRSNFVYRIEGSNEFVSHGLKDQYKTTAIHVDVNIVSNDILDVEAFKKWQPDYKDASFVLENGKYHCGYEVEKMSKAKYNVVNPDHIVDQYGADTFRMYEMFLGPIEIHKPWDTQGIEGVHRFLKKFWRLFFDENGSFNLSTEEPSDQELKVLHKTIKKVSDDIDRFAFNTAISAFMVCVNELTSLKCRKQAVLKDLTILIAPFAPHIAEELWHLMGFGSTVTLAAYPDYEEAYIKEDSFTYPVAINGKVRVKIDFPLDWSKDEIEKEVIGHNDVQRWLDGKTHKKFILVPGRMINLVV